ncbi:MAG: GldG family protein, partial [Anaerolineae bacterium]|nr:GldG family protein [Anaerolineae bacterium]
MLEELAGKRGGAYTFTRTTAALSRDLLAGYDALILPPYSETLSGAEINAVVNFVDQGGGLMILGDAYFGMPNPELTTRYGFSLNPVGVFTGAGQEGVFEVPLIAEHASVAGDLSYTAAWGQSLVISDAVNIMDTLSYDAWEDANGNDARDDGEQGRYSMAAAFDTGCGRVIGFGDNVFSNDAFGWTDNHRVFRSMLSWLTDAQGCHQTVLIDESHDNRLTGQWSRAEEIVADQGWGYPTYYILDTFAERLDDDFAFIPNSDAELTLDLMQNFDAVMIPQYFETMSAAEVKAVNAYVRQGGGVLFLGDAAYDNPNPELTARFGFTFRNEVLFAPVPQPQPQLMIGAFADHPSVHDLMAMAYEYKMEGGCSVELGSAAVPILTTAGLNAWRDVDWNGAYTADVDETGDFAVAAVYDDGCGRVAVISDDHFGNDPLWTSENQELVRGLLSWVSMGTECNPISEVYLPVVLAK